MSSLVGRCRNFSFIKLIFWQRAFGELGKWTIEQWLAREKEGKIDTIGSKSFERRVYWHAFQLLRCSLHRSQARQNWLSMKCRKKSYYYFLITTLSEPQSGKQTTRPSCNETESLLHFFLERCVAIAFSAAFLCSSMLSVSASLSLPAARTLTNHCCCHLILF